ncbi:MAG TPA: ubiquinol-cytochrome C chaperone family protein [Stellaceae bacterium]|nr:ubiquinol-cytochrome C chaperone family protein [Stellaceae bacterium]
MFTLFRPDPLQTAARCAYERVVAQARRPGFFTDAGVPDTVAGRFELICLHAFLYLHRLKREQPQARPLGQRFFDAMFLDLDRSLREMGTGDLSVGREVRRMAEAFYGRIAAYEGGLAGGDAALQAALARNLFGTASATAAPRLGAMAAYVRGEVVRLRAQDPSALLAGEVAFGEPPRLPDAAEPTTEPTTGPR